MVRMTGSSSFIPTKGCQVSFGVAIAITFFFFIIQGYFSQKTGELKRHLQSQEHYVQDFKLLSSKMEARESEYQQLLEKLGKAQRSIADLKNCNQELAAREKAMGELTAKLKRKEAEMAEFESVARRKKQETEARLSEKKIEFSNLQKKLTDLQLEYDEKERSESQLSKLVTDLRHQLSTKIESGLQSLSSGDVILSEFGNRRYKNITMQVGGGVNSWQQRTFMPHGYYNVILYSAYRLSPTKITAIGLTDNGVMPAGNITCTWYGNNGEAIPGYLLFSGPGDVKGIKYWTALFHCILNKATGTDGGHLVGTINEEAMVLFHEEAGVPLEPAEPWSSQLTYCSHPMFGKHNLQHVWEWIEYNRIFLGADKFILYEVNALDQKFRELIQPYMDTGLVEIANMSAITGLNTHDFGQKLAMADCHYRSMFTSRWVYYLDFDEYLFIRPPATMKSILEKYKNKSYFTHGALDWDIAVCDEDLDEMENISNKLSVETMIFRKQDPFCLDVPGENMEPDLCLKWIGHRKFFLNPREVLLIHVHEVLYPADNGVDIRISGEVFHAHYRGLIVGTDGRYKGSTTKIDNNADFCREIVKEDEEPPRKLVRDDSVARLIPGIRKRMGEIMSSPNSLKLRQM